MSIKENIYRIELVATISVPEEEIDKIESQIGSDMTREEIGIKIAYNKFKENQFDLSKIGVMELYKVVNND
jgi:hypothetical protein